MAEAVGLAASIIAVLNLTGRVISLSYGYISGVSRAPDNSRRLVDEIYTLDKALIILQEAVTNNPQSSALGKLDEKNGPLERCAQELKELRLGLEPKQGWRGTLESLKWPLKEKDTLRHLSQIERYKSLFTFALTSDQIALSKGVENCVQNTGLVIKNLRMDFQAEAVSQSQRRQEEENIRLMEKRQQVLSWLHPGAFDTKHNEVCSQRQENTGNWFLKSSLFENWTKQKKSTLLWGYGIPGAGKTFLSSIVIDHFQLQETTAEFGLAYIYFDWGDKDGHVPTNIISSIVSQLASRIPQLPTCVEHLYDRLNSERKTPILKDLYATLTSIARLFDRVFLVFDALDECDQRQRHHLLPLLRCMNNDGINIFFTSRQHPEDIRESFSDATKVELSAQEEDIRMYIQQKVKDNPRISRLAQQSKCSIEMVTSELVDCAKGMFLLVRFQLEYLCQQNTARSFLKAFKELKNPSTRESPLYSTYSRAIEKICRQQKSSSELAFKVLGWILKARRTLTVDEIRVAVSIEPGRYGLDDLDLPDRSILLDVCASLITIDENTNTVRLAHYTIQEYLVDHLVIDGNTEFILATVCITLLSFDIFILPQNRNSPKPSLGVQGEPLPLFDYALNYLSSHIEACQENLPVSTILRFSESSASVSFYRKSLGWKTSSRIPIEIFPSPDAHKLPIEKSLRLDIAACLGHEEAVSTLLEQSPTLDKLIPIYVAAAQGHVKVVDLLIKMGVDLSRCNKLERTVLHAAVSGGHTAVVQLLLRSKVDASAPDKNGDTPIHLATYWGHELIVRELLEFGADPSTLNNSGTTAVHEAAYRGHGEVTRLLLDHGLDRSLLKKVGNTALGLAARAGHDIVVRLLLERGCHDSIPDQFGKTTMHWAASYGYSATVEILLKYGHSTSIVDAYGDMVLHVAAFEGYDDIVRILIEGGAELEARDQCGGHTAMHRAAFWGHIEVIKCLLQAGASISPLENNGKTPLHIAAARGYETVVRLLIEKGSDISIQDSRGLTALHAAAAHGEEGVVRLLFERGCNILTCSHNGHTPLQLSAAGGDETLVQFILEQGGDSSILDRNGFTALHMAVIKGHEEVVEVLLKNGTDPSISGRKGLTALHLASYQGSMRIVRMLLENGVSSSVLDGDGNSALHFAVHGRNEAIPVVELLIRNAIDISIPNNQGRTTLHIATLEGHNALVKFLLDRGADPLTCDKNGQSPLHLAAANGRRLLVELLLDHGADSFLLDNDGQTALGLGIHNGHKEVVKILEVIHNRGGMVGEHENLGVKHFTPDIRQPSLDQTSRSFSILSIEEKMMWNEMFCRRHVGARVKHLIAFRLDCPHNGCQRVGNKGFIQKVNLLQHRRLVHQEAIPKVRLGRTYSGILV